MHITFKSLVLTSAALCATAAFAATQSRVDVPFSFTAQGQSFPAGSYEVALNANRTFVTLSSKTDTTKHITWSVGPSDAIQAPSVVKFDATGADYSLRSIQVGSRTTPNLDTQKHAVSATTSIGGQ